MTNPTTQEATTSTHLALSRPRPLLPSTPALRIAALAATAMGGIALAAASPWILRALRHLPVICPFRALAGLPCPGCGTTRSFFALAGGRVLTAVRLNPLGLFLWLFLGAVVAFKAGVLSLPSFKRARGAIMVGGLAAAFVAWFLMLGRRMFG
jgi:hypothetical protein